jgi:hypothetical protein
MRLAIPIHERHVDCPTQVPQNTFGAAVAVSSWGLAETRQYRHSNQHIRSRAQRQVEQLTNDLPVQFGVDNGFVLLRIVAVKNASAIGVTAGLHSDIPKRRSTSVTYLLRIDVFAIIPHRPDKPLQVQERKFRCKHLVRPDTWTRVQTKKRLPEVELL